MYKSSTSLSYCHSFNFTQFTMTSEGQSNLDKGKERAKHREKRVPKKAQYVLRILATKTSTSIPPPTIDPQSAPIQSPSPALVPMPSPSSSTPFVIPTSPPVVVPTPPPPMVPTPQLRYPHHHQLWYPPHYPSFIYNNLLPYCLLLYKILLYLPYHQSLLLILLEP